MDELTFRDPDGIEVFYRRWLPAGTPRATVLVAHGLSEHSGRYGRFADALLGRQYAVYAPDHRGHGRTAKSTGVGRAGTGGMDAIVENLHHLREIATSEVATEPVVLFGHSMGALVAQAYAERHGAGLAALVLSGSPGVNDVLAELATGVQSAVDAGMGDEPLDALAFEQPFEPIRTKYDWLSRDAAEVDAYIADPLCGDDVPPTYAFIAAMMQLAVDEMQPAAIAGIPRELPVLLVTGERDIASNEAAAVRELESRLRARGLDVDARYYPDARHEVLNELNRDEVTADIVAWLDTRV